MELQYLAKHGQTARINRDTPEPCVVSLKQSSRGSDFALRDSAFEGWLDSKIDVGETITLVDNSYLVFATHPLRRVWAFTARKCNSTISILEFVLTEDQYGNPVESYVPSVVGCPVYGQNINATVRALDPGLLATTVRVYFTPFGAKIDDCIVHQCTQEDALEIGAVYDPVLGGVRMRVDSVDDILITGLFQIQVSIDKRWRPSA